MARPTEICIPANRFLDKHASPERTIVWTEPKRHPPCMPAAVATPAEMMTSERRVPVVYYLSRNGKLEHPHFMEVPLSSPDGGLFLSDVIGRLNLLRGRGMASMYSWSSKRRYKSGFVWHDLAENDFIHPSHGVEYVLKGSEILETLVPSGPLESVSFRSLMPSETAKSGDEGGDFPVMVHRRNQSLTSIDPGEYMGYKTELSSEMKPKIAAEAATQTIEMRRRRRPVWEKEDELAEIQEKHSTETQLEVPNPRTELRREEISPPPSDSSPETLEILMRADKCLALGIVKQDPEDLTASTNAQCTRPKASAILKQLITCGSLSQVGFPVGQNKVKQPGVCAATPGASSSRLTGMKFDDNDYSLPTAKKEEASPSLK